MTEIRYVSASDQKAWFALDAHLTEEEFEKKVRDRQGYVLLEEGKVVGILRYNLFWDNIPFCTMLFLDEKCRNKGYGSKLMTYWEKEMLEKGYGMVLVSTQVDETAQHFYRKLGYQDCGCLCIHEGPYAQPMELFMEKVMETDDEDYNIG